MLALSGEFCLQCGQLSKLQVQVVRIQVSRPVIRGSPARRLCNEHHGLETDETHAAACTLDCNHLPVDIPRARINNRHRGSPAWFESAELPKKLLPR
jgi:hypothetical protein